MVGVAYSFVKFVVEILRIQSFSRVYETRATAIGPLTGSELRVSMAGIVQRLNFPYKSDR